MFGPTISETLRLHILGFIEGGIPAQFLQHQKNLEVGTEDLSIYIYIFTHTHTHTHTHTPIMYACDVLKTLYKYLSYKTYDTNLLPYVQYTII